MQQAHVGRLSVKGAVAAALSMGTGRVGVDGRRMTAAATMTWKADEGPNR